MLRIQQACDITGGWNPSQDNQGTTGAAGHTRPGIWPIILTHAGHGNGAAKWMSGYKRPVGAREMRCPQPTATPSTPSPSPPLLGWEAHNTQSRKRIRLLPIVPVFTHAGRGHLMPVSENRSRQKFWPGRITRLIPASCSVLARRWRLPLSTHWTSCMPLYHALLTEVMI